jgi:hypothetical protein
MRKRSREGDLAGDRDAAARPRRQAAGPTPEKRTRCGGFQTTPSGCGQKLWLQSAVIQAMGPNGPGRGIGAMGESRPRHDHRARGRLARPWPGKPTATPTARRAGRAAGHVLQPIEGADASRRPYSCAIRVLQQDLRRRAPPPRARRGRGGIRPRNAHDHRPAAALVAPVREWAPAAGLGTASRALKGQ